MVDGMGTTERTEVDVVVAIVCCAMLPFKLQLDDDDDDENKRPHKPFFFFFFILKILDMFGSLWYEGGASGDSTNGSEESKYGTVTFFVVYIYNNILNEQTTNNGL